MTDDATRTLVRDFYASYARGDIGRVTQMIDENINWIIHGPVQMLPFLGPRQGKAEVMEALAAIARDYALERYDPEIIIVEEDRAAVMSNVAFVQRATQRTLSFRVVDLLRFRGQRVIEFHEFSDTFDVVEQALGRWLVV